MYSIPVIGKNSIMEEKNTAQDFIQRLAEDGDFRSDIGPDLLKVEEGAWHKVVAIAEKYGFRFTAKELIAAVPEGFYKGKGKNPAVGWDVSTRNS